MSEIYHIIPIAAAQKNIYQALVTESFLQRWWLPNASTTGKVNSIATFPLSNGKGLIKMKIIQLDEPTKVKWECLEHLHTEWIGTTVEFKIVNKDKGRELHFKHSNWKNTNGVFGLVSYYWAALYLTRLKELLETNQAPL